MSTKSKLLKSLEKNKGIFVSGQDLAHNLDVSRTSIWKAIKDLRNEGYLIKAITNKGYMLSSESSILSPEAIDEYLDPRINIRSIDILKSTDSTNNEAKRIIMQDSDKSGTVIFAEEQTAGKGRLGRNFSSPPGESLYVSFILKPLLDVKDSLLITVAASVAVARAVKQIGKKNHEILEPKIKWVNDVYLEGKKICGILTEAVSDVESGQIQSLILGIGININVDFRRLPEDVRKVAGTLRLKHGQRNEFAAVLINEIFRIQDEIAEYTSSGLSEPEFMEEYRNLSMVLDEDILVIKDGNKIEAHVMDIDSRGGLLVKYKTDETELLNTGEISIRLNN